MDIETTLSSRQSIITSGLADAYECNINYIICDRHIRETMQIGPSN